LKTQLSLQQILSKHLIEARLRNPAYSQGALARKAGISPSALSEILREKRRVSPKRAREILEALCVDPERIDAVLGTMPAKLRRKRFATEAFEFKRLEANHFSVISDWYHFAILSLSETQDYRHDPKWIAKRLGIKVPEARAALSRLKDLGLLSQDPSSGSLIRGASQYTTSDDVADLALRKAHGQNLELARASLERDEVAQRDFSAVTMAIDPKKLPAAKKMIRKFQDRLCAFLESGEKKQVHKLCMHLVPLTRPEKTERTKESS
jgi:uncharacterized protein (TIGR02147 family)